LARIVHGLHLRQYGWSLDAIQEELRVSERTLLRYLAVCRRELVDENGAPILDIVRRGDRRLLQLHKSVEGPESTSYEVLLLYFALSVFRFLDGTVIKDGVDGLWERLWDALPQREQRRLADFNRKFYVVPHAVKDYQDFDSIIDTCIRCLVYQRRMRIDYRGLLGEGREHEFDPYTLTMYSGGLYLIGYSLVFRKIIWLAIERIREVSILTDTFEYPQNYSPQKHTAGTFGIVDGPETRVELLLRNEDTAAYLAARRLHPTQSFRKRRDGTTLLTMTLKGTAELVSWILGMGAYVEVLKPKALRDEIAGALREAAQLYATDRQNESGDGDSPRSSE